MTTRIALIAILAAAVMAAPASAAGPVPLLASRSVDGVAVAGSDVIVSRSSPLGAVRIDAFPTGGRPSRPLLSTPPRGDEWFAFTAVAASPQRVAVVAEFISPDSEITRQLYSGPPSGPLTLVTGDFQPDDVAVDGDRVLVLEHHRETVRLRLLVPGAAPRVIPLATPPAGSFAFAGQRLAYQADHGLVVADLATGTRLLSARTDDFVNHLDVMPDGRVLADGDDIGVFTIMPSGLRQGVADGEFLSNARAAGSTIAAIEDTESHHSRPVVLPPGAIHPRPIGLPSETIDTVDADPRGVAWLANNCVLYATLDATAPAEPPAGPCARAEVEVQDDDLTVHGRRLRLIAACVAATAAGCNGTATVRAHGIRGRGAFHVAAGRSRHFRVRFTRRSVRRIRREVRESGSVFLDATTRMADGGPPDRGEALFIDKVR